MSFKTQKMIKNTLGSDLTFFGTLFWKKYFKMQSVTIKNNFKSEILNYLKK